MQVARVLKTKGSRIVTARPDATVAEVARTLKAERIGAIVITDDGGRVVGILSERDIVRALPEHGAGLLDKRVADLMTREVVSCSPEDDLDHIRREMTGGRFRHIPVIEDGKLVGIVSIGDIVKNRLEELESERQQLREYISSG